MTTGRAHLGDRDRDVLSPPRKERRSAEASSRGAEWLRNGKRLMSDSDMSGTHLQITCRSRRAPAPADRTAQRDGRPVTKGGLWQSQSRSRAVHMNSSFPPEGRQ